MIHYVHFSKQSLTQMLLNGFEAFVIKHLEKRSCGIEMHASLYGWLEESSRTLHHHVEFISVDTSAEMATGSVMPNPAAQALKRHLAEAVDFSCLGGLHTHPYLLHEMDLQDVRERGCDFSPGDLECFTFDLQQMAEAGDQPIKVEVVLTIKQIERTNIQRDGNLDGQGNVFEFAVGNCKCFLRAQVFTLDDNNQIQPASTVLKCEYLDKFKYVGTDFGKVKVVDGKKRILEHKV
jgi:hypothetical protein